MNKINSFFISAAGQEPLHRVAQETKVDLLLRVNQKLLLRVAMK